MSCPVYPRTHTLQRKTGKRILAEPFDDAAFVSRLQKLMSMLGSEQPGEAEAARRKLVEHLATHRLSLTDVALRLRERARMPVGAGASFAPSGPDAVLERQLASARAGRLEAEAELRRSQTQVMELQRALQEAAFDMGRTLRGRATVRVTAFLGWIAAAAVLLLATFGAPLTPVRALLHPLTAQHDRSEAVAVAPPANGSDPTMRLAAGEHYGVVLVQDLPVRLNPSDDAGVRAFLNRGMHVVIEQQTRAGTQSWLLIRSVTGNGWVHGPGVLH